MEIRNIHVILFSILSIQFLLTTASSEADQIALLAFKSNLKYIPQGKMSSWNASLHFCQWEGITCGRRHKRVTVLDLSSYGLVGSISPYIGNLTFMRQILMAHNTFQGTIPPEIGRLWRLEQLILQNNSFEGEIPTNLFRCSNLEKLHIGTNKLVGKIPDEFGSLPKLKFLSVYENNLIGGIPKSIGNLTSLEQMSLSFNKLGGNIPDIFYRLNYLNFLGIGDNELVGTIPPSIYNLSLLKTLSFGINNLHGTLPQNIGILFPRLNYFQIYENNLTGLVPYSLSNASNLEVLEIPNNKFSGKLSIDFCRLTRLRFMSVFSNNLGIGGAGDLNFMTSLLNCSNVAFIQLQDNFFGGELPKYVGNVSTKFTHLIIDNNIISGSIPSWIGTLTNLAVFSMSMNNVRGPIPDVLGYLQKLSIMILSDNMLSGTIPTSLGNMSSMIRLYLDTNKLHGVIPASLGKYQYLVELNLSNNSLSGEIPKQLFNIPRLSISLDLSHNQLVGRLPEEVGNLKSLKRLDLFENKLSGEIPNGIGGCSSLEILKMGGNFFRGIIPQTFSSLRGIAKIDLSRNNLTGKIPILFERLALTYLNLSFNDLEGEVPIKGVFENATLVSVFGNKRLCGGISQLELHKCSMPGTKKMSILIIILITIACFLFGAAGFAVLIYFRFKREKVENSSSSIQPLLKVSYAMLFKATDGFSTTKLIGTGGFGHVYKGILGPDEQTVAIKVLNLHRQGATKSFIAECKALKSIRHRNLVKIITSCSSIDFKGNDFKALVYEFMPNGSLETWLHSISNRNEDQLHNIDLVQIINIAIDVASALEYLHHLCEPPIIHCDLKPSNILLDSNMTAHVGDFGLAKFLQVLTSPNQSSSIGIRGTIGYVAPEYGVGSMMSTSGDVYSFGIVLLGMMTGMKPTDACFEVSHNLHNFAKYALPDRVKEIVDPILLSESEEMAYNNNTQEESLISMVRIGVACSVESPQDRMDIRSVVRELHLAKKSLEPTIIRHPRHRVSNI